VPYYITEYTNDHGSDHYRIEIILELNPKKHPPIPLQYNYSKTNRELIKIELECLLPSPINPNNISADNLDNYTISLTKAYQNAIAKYTPRK
jgi:hypothetical protein